jgi:hypothetical protein
VSDEKEDEEHGDGIDGGGSGRGWDLEGLRCETNGAWERAEEVADDCIEGCCY